MKKIIVLLGLLILITSVITLYIKKGKKISILQPKKITTSVTPYVSPTPSNVSSTSKGYKSVWLIVRSPDKLALYPNFEEKLDSLDAAQKFNCAGFISGGFFSEKDEPIGLFVYEGRQLKESQKNSLFDGYFSVSGRRVIISTTAPINPRIAIQSGPILMQDTNPKTLSLKNDENARRIVVAKSQSGEAIFLAIYDKSTPLNGPKLEELPQIISEINKNSHLSITEALNLDGGAHSAFISDLVKLTEVSKMGSFFCIKP